MVHHVIVASYIFRNNKHVDSFKKDELTERIIPLHIKRMGFDHDRS